MGVNVCDIVGNTLDTLALYSDSEHNHRWDCNIFGELLLAYPRRAGHRVLSTYWCKLSLLNRSD